MAVNLLRPSVTPVPLSSPQEPTPLVRDSSRFVELYGQDKVADGNDIRKKFAEVMGELLFGQLLKAMRKTVGKPAYLHGGQAEEIFRQQLDQVLAQKISESSGEQFVGPMYELCMLGRR